MFSHNKSSKQFKVKVLNIIEGVEKQFLMFLVSFPNDTFGFDRNFVFDMLREFLNFEIFPTLQISFPLFGEERVEGIGLVTLLARY